VGPEGVHWLRPRSALAMPPALVSAGEVGLWTATRAHKMVWLVFKQPGPQRAIAACGGCIRLLLMGTTGRRFGLVTLLRGHAAFLR
jgi:hypothetical protein